MNEKQIVPKAELALDESNLHTAEQAERHSATFTNLSRELELLPKESSDPLIQAKIEAARAITGSTLDTLSRYGDDVETALKHLKAEGEQLDEADEQKAAINREVRNLYRVGSRDYPGPEEAVADILSGKRNPLEGRRQTIRQLGSSIMRNMLPPSQMPPADAAQKAEPFTQAKRAHVKRAEFTRGYHEIEKLSDKPKQETKPV